VTDWVPAGERFRIAYGYQSSPLNVHRSIAYAAGVVRVLASMATWGAVSAVSPSFVEVLDRSTGATLRRWNLAAEDVAPVSTMEYIVKDLTADLMLLDVHDFEERYRTSPG
jgi:hypothetical protein